MFKSLNSAHAYFSLAKNPVKTVQNLRVLITISINSIKL